MKLIILESNLINKEEGYKLEYPESFFPHFLFNDLYLFISNSNGLYEKEVFFQKKYSHEEEWEDDSLRGFP